MSRERDQKLYDSLTATGRLLEGREVVEGEEYSVESILAEFGRGAAEPAPEERPSPASPQEETAAAEERHRLSHLLRRAGRSSPPEEAPPLQVISPAQPPARQELSPDRISLKDIMSQTVDSVLAENEDGILPTPPTAADRLHRLLHRKKDGLPQDTEELFPVQKEAEEEEPLPPEPDSAQAEKEAFHRETPLGRLVVLASLPMLLLMAAAILEEWNALPELWGESDLLRCGVLGGLLLLAVLLCAPVWRTAAQQLSRGRGSAELASLALCLASLLHCVYGALSGQGEALLAAPASFSAWLSLAALWREAKTRRESFHMVWLGGEPLYLLTNTELGLCKQKGSLAGFYHTTEKMDPARKWHGYTVLFFLGAATILSGLLYFTRQGQESFFTLWSVMLTASLPACLPLNAVFPLAQLQQRLNKSGAAVAGYQGGRAVSRSMRLVLTDDDVFPPGTVAFNGYKVFGEERSKIMSYAVSLTKTAGSQLHPLFEQQLSAEGGSHLRVEDFHFLEEGGAVGTIRGERVAMGSAYFMKKQHVALPHDLKLPTGVFLAVDGMLAAVFAIKYQPSRNVEWALRALRRSRIRPVLAVRSGNVTPGLVRRKFGVDTKPIYPDITTRLALSDVAGTHGGKPNAVLYREGLMPLAETFIGAKRMVKAVRRSIIFAYLAGAAGLLLGYYLLHAGNFAVLTSLDLLIFQGLWLIPTLIFGTLVKHY